MASGLNRTLLMAGQVVSKAGDQLANVSFIWLVTTLTGSAAALSWVMTAMVLPNVAFRLAGGLLTDRVRKQALLIASDAFRAVLIAVLAVLTFTRHLELWQFLIVAAGLGVGEALFNPAFNALIPLLVDKEQLFRWNSSLQSANQGASVAIPVLSGVIIAAIGVAAALFLDSASFLVSAVSIALLVMPMAAEQRSTRGPSSPWDQLQSGLKVAMADSTVLSVLIAAGIINFADALVVIYPVYLKESLHAGVAWFGFVNAAVPAGLLSANLILVKVSKRVRTGGPLLSVLFLGAAAQGIGILLFGLNSSLPLDLVAFWLFGAGMAGFGTSSITLIQQQIETDFLGRVISLYGILAMTFMPVGYAVAAAMSGVLSTKAVLILSGCLMLAAAAFLLVMRLQHKALLSGKMST